MPARDIHPKGADDECCIVGIVRGIIVLKWHGSRFGTNPLLLMHGCMFNMLQSYWHPWLSPGHEC